MEREATHPFPSSLARPAASRRRAYYVPEKEQRNNIKVTRNVLYVVGLDDMKDYGGGTYDVYMGWLGRGPQRAVEPSEFNSVRAKDREMAKTTQN